MSISLLFFAGILAGISISQLKKSEKHGPMVDMMYGMMGSTLMGGEIGQFTSVNFIILLIAMIGAILFVKIGRTIPMQKR